MRAQTEETVPAKVVCHQVGGNLKVASEHVDVRSVASRRAPDIALAFPELLSESRCGTPSACRHQRTVIMLRIVADLPINEVARIVRKRTGAVKALQHWTLSPLRRRIPDGLS